MSVPMTDPSEHDTRGEECSGTHTENEAYHAGLASRVRPVEGLVPTSSV